MEFRDQILGFRVFPSSRDMREPRYYSLGYVELQDLVTHVALYLDSNYNLPTSSKRVAVMS